MPFGTWVFQYGTCIIRVNLGPLRCVERTYKWSSGLRPRQVLKSDRKWKWQSYELDILQPFSVILMRLICINLSWIKSYGINQIFFCFIFFSILYEKKNTSHKWPFFDHIWPFFWQLTIFHKTEVQTILLRCLVYLYLHWIKSYDIILVKNFFFMPENAFISGLFFRSEFRYLLRKPALIFSKRLFFQNSFGLSWDT